jgi:FMN reductase
MMTAIVVVSGNPRPGSRTHGLAVAVGAAVARRQGAPEPDAIDVGALGTGLLVPDDPATTAAVERIRGADLLVVATPTYKGTFTGVLKVLLDRLPAQALAGKTAVPVVTAGIEPQAAGTARYLGDLLRELGAEVVPGLAVVEAQLPEAAELAEKFAATLG